MRGSLVRIAMLTCARNDDERRRLLTEAGETQQSRVAATLSLLHDFCNLRNQQASDQDKAAVDFRWALMCYAAG